MFTCSIQNGFGFWCWEVFFQVTVKVVNEAKIDAIISFYNFKS